MLLHLWNTGIPKGALFTNRQLQAISTIDTGGAWGGAGHPCKHRIRTRWRYGKLMVAGKWGNHPPNREVERLNLFLQLIHDHRISAVSAIAPQIALMLQVNELDRFDFDCVKRLSLAELLASPELVKAGREFFGAPWSIRYALQNPEEVGLGTSLDADDEEALYTVGRPRPGIEATIRDEDGRPAPAGDIGEIWIRSNAVMSRYWNDPSSTEETIVEGWLRTGDLAFQDTRGCFHLAGRTSEMFIRGGYNIFPLEIERAISTHSNVSGEVVIPRKDEIMGEIGVAVIAQRYE